MRCCNLRDRRRMRSNQRRQPKQSLGHDRIGLLGHHLGMHSSCCCCDRSVFWHVKWPLSAPVLPLQTAHWLPFNNIMKTRVLQLIRVAALLAFFRFVVCNSSALSCCLCLSVCQPASEPACQLRVKSSPQRCAAGGRLGVVVIVDSGALPLWHHAATRVAFCATAATASPRHKSQKQPNTCTFVWVCVCVRQALAAQAQAIIFQYANVLVPQNGAADAVEARGTDDAVVNHIHIRIQLLRPSCAH